MLSKLVLRNINPKNNYMNVNIGCMDKHLKLGYYKKVDKPHNEMLLTQHR